MADRPDSRSDFYRTPHLEGFAREGMIFSNAYAPAPVCTPSRNSMLYGMTPARLRNATLNTDAAKENNVGVLSIPQALKQADPAYVTAHFGKWHMPFITPTGVGYDVTDGPTGNGEGDLDDDNRPLPEDDPLQRQPNISLAKERLGWEPQIQLQEGLEKSIPYFKKLLP